MFLPINMRSANAYQKVGIESAVLGADAHQMIGLLFEDLMKTIGIAKFSLRSGDIVAKGKAIGRAVRFIEEGLKAVLNDVEGGEVAANLRVLYSYCVVLLSEANLRNDPAKLEEAEKLLQPVAQAWIQIRPEVAGKTTSSFRAGV